MVIDKTKQIIGRKVLADFPKLGLNSVVAKIDTGAYRGTLHCTDIKLVQRLGVTYLSVKPLDPQHQDYVHKSILFKKYGRAWVKTSTGHPHKRFFVETDIIIGGQRYRIELSLYDRRTMRTPVLIGRKFLRKRFIVDVDRETLKPRRTS